MPNYADIAKKYGGTKYSEVASKYGGRPQEPFFKDITSGVRGTQPFTSPIPMQGQDQSAFLQQKGQEAQSFLEKPWYQQILSKQFAREVPGAAWQVGKEVAIGAPARITRSVLETPETLLRLGKEPTITRGITSKIPVIGKRPSYIEEAGKKAEQIVAEATGEREVPTMFGKEIPWQLRALQPFAEVPLAALETVQLAKGIYAAGKGLNKFWNNIKQSKALKKSIESITLSPDDLSKGEYEKMLNQGKVIPKTKTKPATVILDDDEIASAIKHNDLLQSKDPVKNVNAVSDRVTEMDASIGNYLETNPQVYNKERLRKYLTDAVEPITDPMAPSQKVIDRMKKQAVDSIVDSVPEDDLHNLWDSRKAFDRTINAKLKAYSGAQTLKKDIVKGVRNSTQDFISDELMNPIYKDTMKDMSNLIKLKENLLIPKAATEKGATGLSVWMKKHPTATKIGKKAGETAALGTVGAGIYSFLRKK